MSRSLVVALAILSPMAVFGADSVAVVAVDGCREELSSGSARLLRGAFLKQGGSKVQSEEQTLSALGGPVRGSVEDAERLLASARLSFREEFGSGGRTTRALDEATAIAMSLPPSEPRRWKTLCDVLSFQSQVYYMDNKAKAEAVLEPILSVDPLFQVDRDRYSPDMWKLTDRVRRRVKATSTATLSVTTIPGGIPVFVNGRNMGKSPVTIDLPPGEYRAEALFGKERALARTVKIKDAVALELSHALDGAVRVESGPCLSTTGTRGARLGALIQLAAHLGVDQAVGVWKEEPEKGEVYVVASAVDSETGQQVREAKVKVGAGKVTPDAIEKLGQFIARGDASPPVKAVVTEPKPVPKDDLAARDDPMARDIVKAGRSRSGYRTAAYVSGGVAIVAAGVGVYGFITSSAKSKERDDLKVGGAIPTESIDKAEDLKSQAKTYKTVGIVGITTGAVAAGAAVGLFLYASGEPSGSKVKVGLGPGSIRLAGEF
jgi:hypothetical protein